MRKSWIGLIFMLAVFVLSPLVSGVGAQDDPFTYDDGIPLARQNWCFDPARWDDGRCNYSDPNIAEWLWSCGWYWAHYEYGAIPFGGVPDWCKTGSDPDNDGVLDYDDYCPWQGDLGGGLNSLGCPGAEPGCYTGEGGNPYSLLYDGIPNRMGNTFIIEGADCVGTWLSNTYTVILAQSTPAEAEAFCADAYPDGYGLLQNPGALWPGLWGGDVYYCHED